MSNSIAPGSSADVNVRVTALTTNPNVPAQYKTIILKKNLVNGVNTLTQAMMNQTNTKYVIKYDYTLGENISLPANCILFFDGGAIKASGINNTIIGLHSIIQAEDIQIFDNIILNGNFKNKYFSVEWFGELIQGTNTQEVATKNLATIQNAIDNAVRTSVLNVIVGDYNDLSTLYNKRIYINGTIVVPSMCSFGSVARSKVGREDPNTILMIYQIANAPIIRIGGSNLSPEWCSNNSYRIAIHDIGLSTTVPANKNSLVYGITNEGVNRGTSFCTFERVYISSCRFGIYIHYTKGDSTGAAHMLFHQVSVKYNIIGVYLKGESQCHPWWNYNTFKECVFSFNYNVGLKIWEFGQQFDGNIIDNCIFEQNGTNYDSEEYVTFGCSGISCYTKKESVLYVQGCYFEQNYASKRTADATPGEGESWFDNSAYGETSAHGMTQNVEPTTVSEQEGAIVAQFTTIDVSNCAIQGSHVFFQSWYDACFYVHDNSYGSNIINTKTKDCLVYYAQYFGTTSTWGQTRRLIINESFIPQNIKRPYSFKNYDSVPTNIFGIFTVHISKNNVFEEEFIENGCLPEDATLYIDVNNSIRNYKTPGTNPGTAIIDAAVSSQLEGSKLKSIKWVLVTNTRLPKSYDNILSYNDIIFEGLRLDNTITAKVWDSAKTKYAGKLIFNNLTLDQDNRSNIVVRGNTHVEFNNCIIKVTNNSFINFISGVSKIVLNNCTFVNETENTYFFIENYGTSVDLEIINCTIPNNVDVSVNPKKGTTTERNAMQTYRLIEGQEFFDTTLHKTVYWNDSDNIWVNALGNPVDTVYPKVIGTPTAGNLVKFNSTDVHDIEDAGVAPQV